MSSAGITMISLGVCAFAAAGTVAVTLYEGSPRDAGWWPLFLLLLPWDISPYIALAGMALLGRTRSRTSMVVLVTTLIVVALGGYVAFDAFVVHLDAQSGIAIMLLPAAQLLAVGIGAIAACAVWVCGGRTRTVRNTRPRDLCQVDNPYASPSEDTSAEEPKD